MKLNLICGGKKRKKVESDGYSEDGNGVDIDQHAAD